MSSYIYRWTETLGGTYPEGEPKVVNGPYQVRGDALSIYRASIMIGSGRELISGEVLDESGFPIDRDAFYTDVSLIRRKPHEDVLRNRKQ